MATRRDELSAHSFARKRTLAAFLQPESRVSDEEAPRPVRAIVPSVVMGVVLVAGCIAWGAIAPSAPKDWDKPGQNIIVDTDSTTRYVVLEQKDKSGKKGPKQLHPVLNYASAKLVLDKGKGDVMEVAGDNIDESPIARGATIGIPYAPDRLPDPGDAQVKKEWAACEKPGGAGGGEPQQGVFVMGGKDKKSLKGKNRLGEGQGLFVQDSKTDEQFIVDGNGTKLRLGTSRYSETERDLLTSIVLDNPGQKQPQKVSTQWLNTLNAGDDLVLPTEPAQQGGPPEFSGVSQLPEQARKVGMVLRSTAANQPYFVVGERSVQAVSPFFAKLMMGTWKVQGGQQPVKVGARELAEVGASNAPNKGSTDWPDDVLTRVNTEADDNAIGETDKQVSCSIYTGRMAASGKPELAAWAGHDYPENIVEGSASAYVSSGSGLLFKEYSGKSQGGGSQYLLTDSGLRYAMATGSSKANQQAGAPDQGEGARARLGYEKAKAAPVPKNWTSLLPKGPTLDKDSASQEQGM